MSFVTRWQLNGSKKKRASETDRKAILIESHPQVAVLNQAFLLKVFGRNNFFLPTRSFWVIHFESEWMRALEILSFERLDISIYFLIQCSKFSVRSLKSQSLEALCIFCPNHSPNVTIQECESCCFLLIMIGDDIFGNHSNHKKWITSKIEKKVQK